MLYYVKTCDFITYQETGWSILLPIERQQHIKKLLSKHMTMKISELSEQLGVSEMTIHRDLKPLIEQGIVMKTFGGVLYLKKEDEQMRQGELCVICQQNIHRRLYYRMFLKNTNQIETACCAHCGLLRHIQNQKNIVQAICVDFLRETTISAPLASYVFKTSLDMGCCQPQVIAFEQKKHAEQFVKGFGGEVYNFQDALKFNHQNMECQH